MKGMIISVLAILGGYTVYRWINSRGQQRVRNQSPAVATQLNLQSAMAAMGFAGPETTVSGVPAFSTTPVANGTGDQIAAALHNNSLSTMSGSMIYVPAFGPDVNQNGGFLVYNPV